jgi:hypothetical protein
MKCREVLREHLGRERRFVEVFARVLGPGWPKPPCVALDPGI